MLNHTFITLKATTSDWSIYNWRTGEPKAIPWTHATPIKAGADAWAHHDIRHGDVVAWPTNLGWMMGPWLIYAALLNRASIALYNGVPLGYGFAKFIQVHFYPVNSGGALDVFCSY